MPDKPAYPLKVFYDGACPVCSRLAAKYRKPDTARRLEFIDIAAPGFDPGAYGRKMAEFITSLNVMDAEGRFCTGFEGLRAIWASFPAGSPYRLLSRLMGLPIVSQVARACYRLFARYRPRKLSS